MTSWQFLVGLLGVVLEAFIIIVLVRKKMLRPGNLLRPDRMLHLVVLAFPKDHPRPKKLIAELYELSLFWRLLWMCTHTQSAVEEGLLARWRSRRGRSERAIRTIERPVRFILKIIVRLLPPSERDRYSEEFRAELLDVPRDTQLSHARSLLRGVVVLRLRRGLRKEAAEARRAKG